MKSPSQHAVEPIGERIKTLRLQRGWSVRHAASVAGISHSHWSRIENGERSADNRFILSQIAQALKVALSDLTGHIGLAPDYERGQIRATVYQTMQAVIEADLDDPPTCEAGPLAPLLQQLDLVQALRAKCDYAGAARLLPELVRGLHAAASGQQRTEALRALVLAQHKASAVVREFGDPASSVMAADRCRQAAAALHDPVMQGMAAWSQSHAAAGCGLYPRALRVAERAVAELEGHLSLPDAHEMLGQLCLLSAFARFAQDDLSGAESAIAEATRLAAVTGQSPALGLNFGPTNINLWKIAMDADGADPGRAVHTAREVDPAGLATMDISRRATFYMDTARALANIGRDPEAIRTLLTAERLAPQRVRLSPIARETVRALLERAKRGQGWSELRGLCERVGIQW